MRQGLERTYELRKDAPPPMAWEEYERRVTTEWSALLDSTEGCKEKSIHKFLIDHPCMIPGADGLSNSGHDPYRAAVLSESPLTGIGNKVPDFMWLAQDSATFRPVFIEIESPCKRWFTKAEIPTHDLVQALNQLAQWKDWLNRSENHGLFYEFFKIPDHIRRNKTFSPEFILIYGRRNEFETRPELSRMRDQFETDGRILMTFDRLRPDWKSSLYIAATKRSELYRALTVPALFKHAPGFAADHACMDALSEAISRNTWMSAERRNFLVERVPYWKEWTTLRWKGVIHSNDQE